MNIEHLKLFTRIAATHNITAAGQELGLSPAVASAYINKLENELGVRLLHRTTRKVSLTSEGKAFLPYAEEVLNGVEAARASVGTGDSNPTGTLRIAAPASFGRMHLIPHLSQFLEQYPNLKIDLRLSDSMIDMVEGGFDIAVRNANLKDSTLIARKLAPDTRIVCASPEYLKRFGKPKTPEDLTQHDCITLAGLENWRFNKDNKQINIKVNGPLQADNGEAVRDACSAGLGITIMSKWCAYQHLDEGKLVQILEEYPLISNTDIWAVYPSSRLLAPKVKAFIDYFSAAFNKNPHIC